MPKCRQHGCRNGSGSRAVRTMSIAAPIDRGVGGEGRGEGCGESRREGQVKVDAKLETIDRAGDRGEGQARVGARVRQKSAPAPRRESAQGSGEGRHEGQAKGEAKGEARVGRESTRRSGEGRGEGRSGGSKRERLWPHTHGPRLAWMECVSDDPTHRWRTTCAGWVCSSSSSVTRSDVAAVSGRSAVPRARHCSAPVGVPQPWARQVAGRPRAWRSVTAPSP